MNAKQQLATAFLAMIIVGTIAFMPVNAGVKSSQVAAPAPASAPAPAPAPAPVNMMATLNTPEVPQEPVKDLTYN